MMHPIELLILQADRFIQAGHDKSGAPAGCNGPHHDPETHFRNSAHWLALLTRLWVLSGEDKYKLAASMLGDFLLSDQFDLREGKLPVMREKAGKDRANGVIGAGWLAEGLLIAGRHLARDDLTQAARKLVRYFPFDEATMLWVRKEPDGTITGIDTTLNHQIWFAMACSMVPDPAPDLSDELDKFCEGLRYHLRHVNNHLIGHMVRSGPLSRASLVETASHFFTEDGPYPTAPIWQNKVSRRLREIHTMNKQKETGYLVFTLHALARLLQSPWGDKIDQDFCMASYNRLLEPDFRSDFVENKWSFAYNPPGFEFPYLAERLDRQDDITSLGRAFYRLQLEKTFDAREGTFTRGNEDPATMTARLYTLSLCSKETLDLING